MAATRWVTIGGTATFIGLLCFAHLQQDGPALPLPPIISMRPAHSLSTASPSTRACRMAQCFRWRAKEAVKRELEAEEAAAPGEMGGAETEMVRRRLMRADRQGDLRSARAAALRAAALSRTTAEACRSLELLVPIFCDAGQHDLELKAASELVALKPHCVRSLQILVRAAACNGLGILQRQVAARAATEEASGGRTPSPPPDARQTFRRICALRVFVLALY